MKTMTNKKVSEHLVDIPPNAGRTVAALRELGYPSIRAVADLVDNSISAGAKHIHIAVRSTGRSGGSVQVIEILDDGCGMNREQLVEALRLGSDSQRETGDLGKYGVGLKTASWSMAKTLQVLTRRKGEPAWEATLDLGMIERQGWVARVTTPTSARVMDTVGDGGTLILLSAIDRLDDSNVTRFSSNLKAGLGRIFRNFLGPITIKVNGKRVEPVDPLMRDHPMTEVRFSGEIDLGHGRQANLTIVELPDLGPIEDERADIVPQKSGFYVLRNRREIMAAQTLGLYKHHHSYSHFRAELAFSGELDQAFHVDVTKSTVLLNDQIMDRIAHYARRYIQQSGTEGRDRAIRKTTLAHDLSQTLLRPSILESSHPVEKGLGPRVVFEETDHGTADKLFAVRHKDGQTILNYNKRHPLVQLVGQAKLKKGIAILDCLCLALAKVAEEQGGQELVEKLNKVLHTLLAEDTWEARDRAVKSKD